MNNSTQIKALLAQSGAKASTLAAEFKVTRSAIYQAIDGGGSRFLRVKMAKKVNLKPSEIWTQNERRSLVVDDALFMLNDDILSEL